MVGWILIKAHCLEREGIPRPRGLSLFLANQSKDRLRRLVRLGKHRCPSLLQDVEAGQLRALTRHIHIDDPAICCFQVDLVH